MKPINTSFNSFQNSTSKGLAIRRAFLTCRSFERQIFDSIDPFVRIRRFHGKFEIDDALADRNIELMSVDNTCETLTVRYSNRNGFTGELRCELVRFYF